MCRNSHNTGPHVSGPIPTNPHVYLAQRKSKSVFGLKVLLVYFFKLPTNCMFAFKKATTKENKDFLLGFANTRRLFSNMAAKHAFKEVLVETDKATFVHITQPVRSHDGSKRSVAGRLLECFDKGQGVLVSNSGPTTADEKVRAFLNDVARKEKTYYAYNSKGSVLSTQVTSCLLIPSNSETFDRKSDVIITKFVKDQHVLLTQGDAKNAQIVKKSNKTTAIWINSMFARSPSNTSRSSFITRQILLCLYKLSTYTLSTFFTHYIACTI